MLLVVALSEVPLRVALLAKSLLDICEEICDVASSISKTILPSEPENPSTAIL